MSKASFLNQNNYRLYNITLAKKLKSIHGAILLAELISQRDFFLKQGKLLNHETHGNGWFYYTIEDFEERTCLSRKIQDSEIKNLIKLGLIEKISFGLPCRRYFRINDDKIVDFIGYSNDPKEQTSLPKKDKLNCPPGTNYIVPDGQTPPYIEEPNKELKERERARDSSSKKKEKTKNAYREFVHLTEQEYNTLLETHKQKVLDEMLDKLNSYKATSGKTYKSDYHTMINGGWVYKEIVSSPKPIAKVNEVEKLTERFEHGKIYKGAECFKSSDSIAFQRGQMHGQVKFKEFGFKEQFENLLRKFGIN